MMGQNLTDKSFENSLTMLLAQANEKVQKDQRSLSNNDNKEMNPQELFLMQMLKNSSLEKHEEPQLEKESNIANNNDSSVNDIKDSYDNKFIKIRYEPKFLFELEKSPLVMSPSYWESELPPIEFFRLNKLNSNENRRERRRSSNARRGSTLKKDKALIDDLKKENNNRNNGTGREDRRTQRARQRENKKRGKFDTSAIEEGDEYHTDTPEWMKEQDKSTGNSMLDFEIWRLKMRIETAKRNGEDVNPDDMAEYAKLKSQISSNDNNDIERKEEIDNEEKKVNIVREENIIENSENEEKTILVEEKVHRSVDDQFDLPLPSNSTSTTGATGSHFSSFFSSEESVEPLENESTKRSSRLISILSDENSNSTNVPKSTLQAQPYLSAQQSRGINNSQQPGLVNSTANENIQSNIINSTPKQFPMMMPMTNSVPNDKNQLFLQSLLSRSMIPPNQGSNPQISQNMNQQFPQQSMGQRLPNGMDPRMMQGFPPNINYFPPNMQMPIPIGGNHMQPPQLSAQQSPSQSPLPPQSKDEQLQVGQNRHTGPPSNVNPQQQQPQQQNLPYGNNSGSVQGMTPNHPLMMLLNKNKRKSNQDIQPNVRNSPTSSPSNNNSPLLPQSQPIVNQQRNINNPHFNNSSSIPNMPVMGNNQMVPSEFGKNTNMPMYPPYMNMNDMNMSGMNMNGMNMNGMNMNGMNMNGMNMNGMNMNGMNMMNPQNIQQNANSVAPPTNRSQTPF